MFVRVKTTPNSPRKSVQIVAAIRNGGKVMQTIVRHVGVALNEQELIELKRVAEFLKSQIEAEHQPQLFSSEEAAEQAIAAKRKAKKDATPLTVDLRKLQEIQRSIVGIPEVYGAVYEQLGFNQIWGRSKRHATKREILKQITLCRIAQPDSKRASVQRLERDFGVRLALNSVYKTMDYLDEQTIDKIQGHALGATQQLLGGTLDVLFYDGTTLYFESFNPDTLRQKGFSKDHKANETQVLLALLVTREGLPVGYEVFPGATFEGPTLIPIVKSLKARYTLDRVVFVADRGLFGEDNLKALEKAEIEYVVGAKLKTQTRALQEQITDLQAYTAINDEVRTLTIERGKGRRLIISHRAKRARKDQQDREDAINKVKKKLSKSKKPKEFVAQTGYKKYLKITNAGEVLINEQAIARSAQWDGLQGVITNATESVENILAHYRGLWQVEESFRIQKHDLKVRPIYHWTESRIRAHLAIAFMSFCCVRHLEHRVRLQYKKLSPEVIRRELSHVQVSLLAHKKTKSVYAMPSSISPDASKIYQVMGVKPISTAYQIK